MTLSDVLRQKTIDDLMNALVLLGGKKREAEINGRIFDCRVIELIQKEIKRRVEN